MKEKSEQFEQRKRDHIRLALDPKVQTPGLSALEKVSLIPEALPEIDFSDVDISTKFLNSKLNSPAFVSSMTAGHDDSYSLNRTIAGACEKHGWMMGVGSQRRELFDPKARNEWKKIRSEFKEVTLIGNIGLTQLIQTPAEKVTELVENLEAKALFVHLNALQEVMQPEGTPAFKGGMNAIEKVSQQTKIPLILKEVGCGISLNTLNKIKELGLVAVDIAGLGGAHWGRIEGYRSTENSLQAQMSETFKDWGVSSVETLLEVQAAKVQFPFELWASGGVRSGLDVVKLLALGAQKVGIASPILKAALLGEDSLDKLLTQIDLEIKTALFCMGISRLDELQTKKVWKCNGNQNRFSSN